MAATLKLCLMCHIEDIQTWNDGWAEMFGHLSTAVGHSCVGAHGGSNVRGARLSLQFDGTFLDRNHPTTPYPGVATSLAMVLEHGGNFWCQVHCATYTHLESTHATVMSAYMDERAAVPPGPYQPTAIASAHVSGRSGGWDSGVDWASITVARGLRRMNSTVMRSHLYVPESLRPYGFSDDDVLHLYNHDAAPGPIDADVATMRLRPFWVDNASCWFDKLSSIYPHADLVGSILMLPMPGRFSLHNKAERRGAVEGEQKLTPADLNACLTEIWTCFMLMTSYQSSISNVWYTQLQPAKLQDVDIDMIAEWVDSINEIMCVHSPAPYAKWTNMNEMCDCFSHTTTMYY